MEKPFFEPPEPFLPPELPPRPPWLGSPHHVVGGAVPLELVVARTPDAAVIVRNVVAYPEGFELRFVVRLRHPVAPDAWPFDLQGPHRGPFTGGDLPPDLLRLGVQFADGSKATNVGGGARTPVGPEDPPPGPVMMPQGGGGGGRRWDHDVWMWPLPPPGDLHFVCEWPDHGIPLTRRTVDAELVRAAAAQAEVLWPEEDDEAGWTGVRRIWEVRADPRPRSDT